MFSLATQPTLPFGHVPLCILGHFSQAIPQTPTFIFRHSACDFSIVPYIKQARFSDTFLLYSTEADTFRENGLKVIMRNVLVAVAFESYFLAAGH